ncbi:prolactin 2 [Esox lucius]|uniref:Prolactin 2 n=1 Tax=Esox lucius TaxID=8010 RepID=A0A3P8Z0E7_ESOLU|nr:prolactin 2 [Esox lucius]
MSRNNIKQVWALLLVLLCVELHGGGTLSAAPICSQGQAGCHVPSLADLFDRVIQHSARMHSISSDLHSEFEQYFVPNKNHIGRINHNCHTSTILTPNGKQNAQRLAREELTEVILKLLVAWRDPLWHFHQSMAHQDDFNNFSSNKALEMSDMVLDLHRGVEKVADRLQNLGMISNSLNGRSSPEAMVPWSDTSGESRAISDHNLLYCFKRDSNKVQNYLKILKCRIVPENGC